MARPCCMSRTMISISRIEAQHPRASRNLRISTGPAVGPLASMGFKSFFFFFLQSWTKSRRLRHLFGWEGQSVVWLTGDSLQRELSAHASHVHSYSGGCGFLQSVSWGFPPGFCLWHRWLAGGRGPVCPDINLKALRIPWRCQLSSPDFLHQIYWTLLNHCCSDQLSLATIVCKTHYSCLPALVMPLPFVVWVPNSANSDMTGLGEALPGNISPTSLDYTAYFRLQIPLANLFHKISVGWEVSVEQRKGPLSS